MKNKIRVAVSAFLLLAGLVGALGFTYYLTMGTLEIQEGKIDSVYYAIGSFLVSVLSFLFAYLSLERNTKKANEPELEEKAIEKKATLSTNLPKAKKQKDFYDYRLIGSQIEELIKLLLEKSGYHVHDYGYERTLPLICKKFREEPIKPTRTILRIRHSPDLLVYDDKNKKLMLVEVKMRRPTTEKKVQIDSYELSSYKQFWDDAVLVVVINKGDIFYVQEIEKLDTSKGIYDVSVEFQKFEEMFNLVKEEDMSEFKSKALEILNEDKLQPEENSKIETKNKSYSVNNIRRKYPRAYEKWSREEDQNLIHEFNEGLKISEIAKMHQRQTGAVRARLKKLDLVS